jgi:hypothetical protein
MISTKNDDVKWFYTYEEASQFKSKENGYKHRYIKGLGSLTEAEYDRIINKPQYDIVTIDDAKMMEMMFGQSAQLRKDYMFS